MIYSPVAILRHLQTYIPRLTNLFTNETSVNAEIVAGTPQTLKITYSNHGLTAGTSIALANGLLDNGINAVIAFTDPNGNDGLRFTTNVAHDLTEDYEPNLTNGQIELRGFTNTNLNGFFDLYAVPSSTTFEILTSEALPTLNGNEILRENREIGINGIFLIDNIPDVNTIEIELEGLPTFDTLAVNGLKVINRYRMSIAADWERAQQLYTKQNTNDLWLFVIMENVISSKDRNIESDAKHTLTAQNEFRIKNVGQFSINVIIPTKEDLGAANAVQLAYDTLYEIFLNVMSGVNIEALGNSNFVTAMISHGAVLYNNAYYAHNFTYENVFETVQCNTFFTNFPQTVAFRRINIKYAEEQDGSYLLLE